LATREHANAGASLPEPVAVGDAPIALRPLDLDRLAHELRSPLSAIQSTADALASGHLGTIEPRHAAYLAGICETARHALAVLDSMAGPDQRATLAGGRTGLIDLRLLATEVTGSMAMLAARSGIKLVIEPCTAPAAVSAYGAATDVRQMLINLISNGIMHAGGGSTVQVSVGSEANEAWIGVADDGRGLPPGLSEQLNAGALADDSGAPVGGKPRARLGLRLTRQLAVENGGRLELSSGPGGARARVVLPAIGSQRAEAGKRG